MTRPKGVPNHSTARVKAILAEVFDKRGGIPAMLEWSNANPTEFYKLWIRCLPAEAKLDIAVNHVVHRNFTGRTIVESTPMALESPTSGADGLDAQLDQNLSEGLLGLSMANDDEDDFDA